MKVSGLEEGTCYFSPLLCLTIRFEGLWNKIRAARCDILDKSADSDRKRRVQQPVVASQSMSGLKVTQRSRDEMTQGQSKDRVLVSIGPVNADKVSVKPDVFPPDMTASPEYRLAVPQPGTNVKNVRPASQNVQTS